MTGKVFTAITYEELFNPLEQQEKDMNIYFRKEH